MFLNKISTFVFVFTGMIVFSQEEQSRDSIKHNDLDEVVVTATRTERQLSSIPMPVTLISKKQLQQSGSVRLYDILLEQTGIVMVSDFGNSEGVQLQGVAADYTLILIDGVPVVGRTSGNIDLRRLTVNNIKQIEIVKGPSSSLYGSEAIGGVINIITEQPKQNQFKGSLQLLTRGGAKNELDINTNIIAKKEKFGVVAGVNLNSSNGFDLTPESVSSKTAYPHQNFTGNLQLSYDFSEKLKALVSNRFYTQDQNTPSSENKQTDWNINGSISHELSNSWNVDYTFYATRFKTESLFNGSTSLFDRSLFRPEVRTKIDFNKSNVVVGVGANFDALERSAFDGRKKYESQYVFGQYDFNPITNLNIVAGARFDNHNEYKSAFSPKLSASYKINDWVTAKTSVGYGFKAPDFRQLYYNFRNPAGGYIVLGTQTLHDLYPNATGVNTIEKELKPENSIGYNFGFQLKPFKNLKIGVNFFRNDIQDLIDTFDTTLNPTELGLPIGTRTFSYRNISEVYTQGVEVDFNYRISNNLKIIAGYQYLDTGDKNQERLIKEGNVFFRKTPSSSSEQLTLSNYFGLPNRSKHTANFKIFYENFEHDFSANIRAVYRSKYAFFDTNSSQGIIDDYDKFVASRTLVNMAIDKTFFNLMTLQFGIDNVFNEQGEENKTSFFTVSNGGNIPNDNALQLGRTIYSRITFKF
ncbi:TonB-dependent receptor [uncultured Tenacibaculum sp.]|uniref:TonB-dependent receptor plug domain-containing protein n=1 Tax=uncultured Tenacibaculum sp. TaxID=174713 RepID=UPI002639B6DF|nr:TonB-dependent receptor [uncultured Tenacibaculum sp.]